SAGDRVLVGVEQDDASRAEAGRGLLQGLRLDDPLDPVPALERVLEPAQEALVVLPLEQDAGGEPQVGEDGAEGGEVAEMGADEDDAAAGGHGLLEDFRAMEPDGAGPPAGARERRGVAPDVVEDAPGEGAGPLLGELVPVGEAEVADGAV